MKSLLIIFLALVSFLTNAQPLASVDHGKIYGVIIDSATNAGVEFASVALLDPATKKPVNGNVCDDKGKFEITKVAVGDYLVSISFIGYITKTIKVQLTDNNKDINLGNI